MDDWRIRLLDARKRLGLGRGRLAVLAGVSAETIRGYEVGRRHPKHDTLEALLSALRLERVESNAIRQSAGFAPVRSLFGDVPGYFFTLDELQDAVETVDWPQFVANDAFEIVAANRAACALWGVTSFQEERRKRKLPVQFNLLAVANERDFPARVENWDEIIEMIASRIKGGPDDSDDIDAPSPYLAAVLAHFTEQDHAFLARLIAAWTRAAPVAPKVRWMYRVAWDHLSAGRMTFRGMVSTASERDGLSFNDWIPEDADTWTRLQSLVTR